MSTLGKTLGTLALILTGLGLQAEDFSPLMQVTRTTWPEKTHIGVICDYRNSHEQVQELALAAGSGSMITVVDIRTAEKASLGAQILNGRQANFLVLLPQDRLVYDGSFCATLAISHLAMYGIPAVGTTPKALRQGAVFSLGDGTNGELLVTDRLHGTLDVILPSGISYSKKASLPLSGGMATITLLDAQ